MPEFVLAAVAWPYGNAEIHAGNLAGAYLPADIFARYHRLKGNHVLMVSGTDSHGTPITVRAEAEKSTPEAIYQRFHQGFLELFQKLGLNYDLFTSTHTENHFKVSQSMFLALKQNGFMYPEKQPQWYSPAQDRFLPDRYVEGTCYICGFTNARSDQCDQCGNLLDPSQLINPRSKIDNSTPELRETEHFFMDLGGLQNDVVEFLKARESYWRPNVLRQSLGQIQTEGLRGRPITRDLDWGIPVPVEGWDGKCLYVWFEAVIGYLSASIEWSKLHNQPNAWRNWWKQPEAKTLYFIGKDNIPFHAIIWPAELAGADGEFDEIFGCEEKDDFVLPYDVPANEFLNLEGKKLSGSRNWVVNGLDALTRFDPDPLRYYLTCVMPETRDTDWDWKEFYHRNNDELVATWGNLANRVLSFAYKHWEGIVPDPGDLTDKDKELLAQIEKGFDTVGAEIEAVHLRSALSEAIRLASEVNKYLDDTAPWFAIKSDKAEAGRAIFVAMKAIDSLKILLSPFLPFTCERLHKFLGYQDKLFGVQYTKVIQDAVGEHTALLYDPANASGHWKPSELKPGARFNQPEPLFKKLDESIVSEERARLGN
ncbi:MAG: methionine--tRNA ligase [Chloroflexi bacterium]|nr:methionine--tRNA ligase [Chloroflexota bacterium]